MIVNGGDSIFDACSHNASDVKSQWKLFHSVYHQNCSLPVVHTIGNHDIWGWDKRVCQASGLEAHYGKKWAIDELGIPHRYYSFDRGGWHFIVLDSIQQGGTPAGYIAKLDDEQFVWLERDLAATPLTTPVIVISHAPIVSACALFRPHSETAKDIRVPGNWMHIDARKLKDLFLKYPNVKICMAGHEHLHGRVDYNGVHYFCGGAVCGSWWDGPYQETAPGFAMVDLYANGSFHAKYLPWGWAAA
jgi:3',5'-cyclic AMP phosphodiesterase CpdA